MIGLQKILLVGRDVFRALRIGIGERWIGQHRFQPAVSRELHFTEVRDVVGAEGKQQDVVQHVLVVFESEGLPCGHRRQALFEPVGIAVDRAKGVGLGVDQRIALGRVHVAGERHQAVVEERIDAARRLNRELGVQPHRLRQIFLSLLDQRRHLLQARCRGDRAIARRVVILFQEREDRVAGLVDIDTRIGLFQFADAIGKI